MAQRQRPLPLKAAWRRAVFGWLQRLRAVADAQATLRQAGPAARSWEAQLWPRPSCGGAAPETCCAGAGQRERRSPTYLPPSRDARRRPASWTAWRRSTCRRGATASATLTACSARCGGSQGLNCGRCGGLLALESADDGSAHCGGSFAIVKQQPAALRLLLCAPRNPGQPFAPALRCPSHLKKLSDPHQRVPARAARLLADVWQPLGDRAPRGQVPRAGVYFRATAGKAMAESRSGRWQGVSSYELGYPACVLCGGARAAWRSDCTGRGPSRCKKSKAAVGRVFRRELVQSMHVLSHSSAACPHAPARVS